MSINWLTVLAEIINFLILVVLLYFVLFKKIVQVMNERQKRLEQHEAEVEKAKSEATELKNNLEKNREKILTEQSSLLAKIQDDANAEKQNLLQKAQQEAKEAKLQWQSEIQSQKTSFYNDLKKEIVQMGLTVSEKILKDLAHADLQSQIEMIFLQKFDEFLIKNQSAIDKSQKVEISSPFPITQSVENGISQKLEKMGFKMTIEKRQNPDLILGIELQIGSTQLSWNIQNYLLDLKEKAEKIFQKHEKAD